MIRDEAELAQASEQVTRLYGMLSALRRELDAKSPRSFELLAESALDELQRLQIEIEEYVGAAKLMARDVDLWVGLRGVAVKWRETPTSVLTAFLDSFRRGVQAIAESTRSGRFGFRPTDELKRACDFRLVELEPGSLQIGLRVPEEGRGQGDLFGGEDVGIATKALREFLAGAEWVASGASVEELATRFGEPRHRRHVLRALKPFVPRPRGEVESVELYGRSVPSDRRITLTRGAGARIEAAFEVALAGREERFVGDVREIDLDRRTFRLRNVEGLGELVCMYSPEMAAAAKGALEKRVAVVGVRQPDQQGEVSNRVELEEIGTPGELSEG